MQIRPKPGAVRQATSNEPSQPAVRSRWKLANLALLFGSLFVCLILGELALRLFVRDWLYLVEDERKLMYQYDPVLGWFPKPNTGMLLVGSRRFTVIHNSKGFRDFDQPYLENTPRILFLGDSFVWGYDVNAEERFTDKLQARHPDWQIFNLGVSGYGTDQEYLLLQKHFDEYKPRVVFLMFSTDNDDSDNCSNVRYGRYYKPYVTLDGTRLQLNGIPVPRGERVFYAEHEFLSRSALVRLLVRAYSNLKNPAPLHNPNPTGAILRDLQKYVESKGATFVIGLQHTHPNLEEFLRYFKIPYVDVTTKLIFPTHGFHWTPEGHDYVCNKVDQFLLEGHFVDAKRARETNAPAIPTAEPGSPGP